METTLTIGTTWDGEPLPPRERAFVRVALGARVVIDVDAPYGGDAAPRAPAGRLDGLWEHEVVEVFLAEGTDDAARYLEIELGPHGHWLALGLAGVRRRACDDVVVSFAATIEGARWRGRAVVEAAEVARAVGVVTALNVYAIRGAPRRFMAAFPVAAGVYARPDFHRLAAFARVADVRDRG